MMPQLDKFNHITNVQQNVTTQLTSDYYGKILSNYTIHAFLMLVMVLYV